MPEDKLLTIHELCAIFNLKPQAARNLYKKYGMQVVRITPTQIRFKQSVVEDFIKNHTVVYKPKE
jgi:hypothetical protein